MTGGFGAKVGRLFDTGYNGWSLYSQQASFPMADEDKAWARLAKKLKGEIDTKLIQDYRGAVSLPFEPDEHKRIVVKIMGNGH